MKNRKFNREFKISAVKLVTEQGYTNAEAARSLGVCSRSISDWLKKFASEAGQPKGEGAAQMELRRSQGK